MNTRHQGELEWPGKHPRSSKCRLAWKSTCTPARRASNTSRHHIELARFQDRQRVVPGAAAGVTRDRRISDPQFQDQQHNSLPLRPRIRSWRDASRPQSNERAVDGIIAAIAEIAGSRDREHQASSDRRFVRRQCARIFRSPGLKAANGEGCAPQSLRMTTCRIRAEQI